MTCSDTVASAMYPLGPRDAVESLAAATAPLLIGVRHHSPAVAAALPALLDGARPEIICIELPADFEPWLAFLADPETTAPVALAGVREGGSIGFYPFADFSPELVAIRWARENGVPVWCCDLPLGDPGWVAADCAEPGDHSGTGRSGFADALTAAGSGRDEDLWDRSVEVAAPGSDAEAVRRAALAVGWALRADARDAGRLNPVDLAREERMRTVIGRAVATGRRVTAVIGAFHAPALVGAVPEDVSVGDAAGSAPAADPVVSLVPYAFELLDSRSGYPAGIRDPQWQQAVVAAGGDPDRIDAAAASAITQICRELRAAGHPAGSGEAAETLRVAGDLARIRALPAPGRGELIEAVSTVLGQGESLGRGRALARALEVVLVGRTRGRIAPGTPRSGLGPSVEAELAALRLPHPGEPGERDLRLDPLRSDLDGRREVLLHRLAVLGAGYGEPIDVAGTGDRTALTSRWKVSWTPGVPVRLDLAGIRGVTAAAAAAGTLRERFRREDADGGPTCAQVLAGLDAAARCDLPDIVTDRLALATRALPAAGTLPELLVAVDLADALRRGHLGGTTAETARNAAALVEAALDAAVRGMEGLAGSDQPEDCAALLDVAIRVGDQRLGPALIGALDTLARTGSPLIQGAAHAAQVLIGLREAPALGVRAAGWIDAATTIETRTRLTGLLSGLLAGVAPLLEATPTAFDPVVDRIDSISDREFLDRLPALRGGFDTLTPAARGRFLRTVTDRIGDRLDLTLDIAPDLLASRTLADAHAWAAIQAWGLGAQVEVTEAAPIQAERSIKVAPSSPETANLSPADRWRLLLGREPERLPRAVAGYAGALDELYGRGRGEGSLDLGDGGPGGQGRSFPTAREWSDELQALFGAEVREEVLARAADAGRSDVLMELDPAAVRPSMSLLTSVLTLAGGMPEQQLARLRPLVSRLVDELARELATRLRPALTGLTTPRPTRRTGGRLDLPRTLRANLDRARRAEDGSVLVVPERPVFATRSRTEADWRIILAVDVSGSMEASVVWSALTAAVLGGVPTLSTHFLAFSTEVIDLSGHVSDPLSLLLEVNVGGGTHIGVALAHAATLVTVPSRTLVVVVSDFEEGYPLSGLLGQVRALATSGVHLLGCAALDDAGVPRYSVPIARQLAAAGMPVAALSPLALAQWVGERLRGENR